MNYEMLTFIIYVESQTIGINMFLHKNLDSSHMFLEKL